MVHRRAGRSRRRSARRRGRHRAPERPRRRHRLRRSAALHPGRVRARPLDSSLGLRTPVRDRDVPGSASTMGEVSIRLDDLPLRDHLRGMTPYGAPQAALPVALNVNENTHPVPQEVADDILDAVALALRDVNRYPDREFTELREGFADYLGYGLTASRSGRRTARTRCCSTCCRHSAVRDARRSASPPPTRCTRSSRGRPERAGSRARAPWTSRSMPTARRPRSPTPQPDVVFLCAPNNPTGTPMTLEVIEAVYDATDGHRRRRRGVPGVRPARRGIGARAAAGPRAARRLAHHEQGVRLRRRPCRLPRRRSRARRRAAARPPAVPPELADAGGRERRAAARADDAADGR